MVCNSIYGTTEIGKWACKETIQEAKTTLEKIKPPLEDR